MNVEKCLKVVGKAVFIKYYYVSANMPDEDRMEMFMENYTEKSKKNRTYNTKRIFRERKPLKDIKIIFNSQKADLITRKKARRIYSVEIGKRSFGML